MRENNFRKIAFRAWFMGEMVYRDSGHIFDMYTDESIMQYTGLKDKNGKEIYECDIMEFEANEWGANAPDNYLEVKWDTYEGWIAGGSTREWGTYCEVIGNIYENPELIK